MIETPEEFDRHVEMMEQLDRRSENGERLCAEEEALRSLLEHLIREYDERIELPEVSPVQVLRYLMEHNGLRRTDLLPIFGSPSVASAVLAGKTRTEQGAYPRTGGVLPFIAGRILLAEPKGRPHHRIELA